MTPGRMVREIERTTPPERQFEIATKHILDIIRDESYTKQDLAQVVVVYMRLKGHAPPAVRVKQSMTAGDAVKLAASIADAAAKLGGG